MRMIIFYDHSLSIRVSRHCQKNECLFVVLSDRTHYGQSLPRHCHIAGDHTALVDIEESMSSHVESVGNVPVCTFSDIRLVDFEEHMPWHMASPLRMFSDIDRIQLVDTE